MNGRSSQIFGCKRKVADYYFQLNHGKIQFSGIIKKTAEKIIVNREEPGQYNSLDDIILIPAFGAKNWTIFCHKLS
jgi:hypothetical protein